MTTLVGKDPNSGNNTSLKSPVDGPGKIREGTGNEVEVRGGEIVEEEDKGKVIDNVGE